MTGPSVFYCGNCTSGDHRCVNPSCPGYAGETGPRPTHDYPPGSLGAGLDDLETRLRQLAETPGVRAWPLRAASRKALRSLSEVRKRIRARAVAQLEVDGILRLGTPAVVRTPPASMNAALWVNTLPPEDVAWLHGAVFQMLARHAGMSEAALYADFARRAADDPDCLDVRDL